MLLITLVCLSGLVIYAAYATCDPLLDGKILARDQVRSWCSSKGLKGGEKKQDKKTENSCNEHIQMIFTKISMITNYGLHIWVLIKCEHI